MSTSAPIAAAPIAADEFEALEQKVLRAVEIVKREREARTSAAAEIEHLQQQLAEQKSEKEQLQAELAAQRDRFVSQFEQHTATHQAELTALQQEREQIRQRVEKLLQQMDDLL